VPDNRTPEGAMPPLELASRVACLEARFAVLDAMAQQGTHYDARDSTSYANTFTQDAVRETYRLTEETPFLPARGEADRPFSYRCAAFSRYCPPGAARASTRDGQLSAIIDVSVRSSSRRRGSRSASAITLRSSSTMFGDERRDSRLRRKLSSTSACTSQVFAAARWPLQTEPKLTFS
jgi:hypothetical protein